MAAKSPDYVTGDLSLFVGCWFCVPAVIERSFLKISLSVNNWQTSPPK